MSQLVGCSYDPSPLKRTRVTHTEMAERAAFLIDYAELIKSMGGVL
jgi:hypothetical protein